MAPAFRAYPTRPGAWLLRPRPILAYAVIALLAVAGAGLLAERGVAAPLACGANQVLCAAP